MRLLTVLLACLPLLGSACSGPSGPGAERVQVVASVYPLAFAAAEVAQGAAEVANLTPPGAESHDLELTPGRIRDLAEADLIVYLGAGFQPSVEEAVAEVETAALDVLETQGDLRTATAHQHEEEEEEEADHEEEGENVDPHVWLDPKRMVAIADAIAERLVEIDPTHRDTYRANAADVEDRLEDLDEEFRRGLARCERDTIVTSHEAFGYLTDAYGLHEVSIAGIDPESEPSPARLAEVARFVERNDITTIYFEVLVPSDLAETLAGEVGIETAQLDPLEGPPEQGDYFSVMQKNLQALQEGLGCR